MTTLTYRGATYTPAGPAKRDRVIELTYRGVRHLLQPARATPARTSGDMVYRGVTYRQGPNGPVVLQKSTTFVPVLGAAMAT